MKKNNPIKSLPLEREQIQQKTVVAQAMEKIRELITSGFYKPGDKIPTEQELAEHFGIGRSSIREAIYMVEQGLADPKEIERTMAYSFIPRYNSVGIFEHHDGYSLNQLQNLQDYLYPYLGASKKAPDLVVNKVKAGDLGMKSGRGFYDWNEESIADFKKRAAEPYRRFLNWNLPRP